MKTVNFILFALTLILIQLPTNNWAQTNEPTALTDLQKEEVIKSLGNLLKEQYVFPDKGKEMHEFITNNWEEEKYTTSEPYLLSEQLTKDLQTISKDLHIRVRWDPEWKSEMNMAPTKEDSLAYMAMMDKREALSNFGFKEVKLLSNGIGYLKLNGFSGSSKAGEIAIAAMNFLAGTEALIIDLRQNGGGSPDMIQLLSSYLFEGDLVHLNDFYYRSTNEITQRWTSPFVSGKRLAETDVYILTSKRTFSAAEEFSYNLKNLGRATLIGETTGGGAHPGGMVSAGEGFSIFIPSGRAINPITGTNWEGTGVTPHHTIAAEKALEKAHILAAENLAKKHDGEPTNPYKWMSAHLKTIAHPYSLSDKSLKEYVGFFGPRTIELRDDTLYYQRNGGMKNKLTAMGDDLFIMENISNFRIRFIREHGNIVGLEGIYENGRRDRNQKEKSP